MDQVDRDGPSLIESLWRYRVVVVAVALLAGASGYVLGSQQPALFDATALVFLTDPGRVPGLDDRAANRVDLDRHVPQQQARASSRVVLAAARAMVDDPPTLREMGEQVIIRADAIDLSLTITATSGDPQAAAELADAVAVAFMEQNAQQARQAADRAVEELERQRSDFAARLEAIDAQLTSDPQNLGLQIQVQNLSLRTIDLDRHISTIRLEAGLRGDGVDVFEAADVPSAPARPRPRIQALAFALLGVSLSGMWAYWKAGRSRRVMHRRDPETVLDAPLLGEIPVHRSLDRGTTGRGQVSPAAVEAYEFVLSSIEFARADLPGTAVLVTSTLPSDGKTTTALQLAMVASRDGRRVVLIDADLRARGLTTMLGEEDRAGLTDLVVTDLDPSEVVHQHRFNDQSEVPVVTAGQRRGDPTALLRTRSFRRSMDDLVAGADLVIIDSSPLLAVADATIVASVVGGLVMVVSHGTPIRELEKARERLRFVSAPLLGYVYNRSATAATSGQRYDHAVADPRTDRSAAVAG